VLFSVYSMTEETNFGVHVSLGSAEILVRKGKVTNYHLLACCFSNVSAKIFENQLMCVEVIVCYISVVFFETQCMCIYATICVLTDSYN